MKKEGFWKWTDTSTSRTDALIHNMMGESIQLHDSYLLDDMCVNRPTIVKYNYTFNYVIEAIISLLFVRMGILRTSTATVMVLFATIIKYNRKTVTLITEGGQQWNVAPTFLRKLTDVGTAKAQSSTAVPPSLKA